MRHVHTRALTALALTTAAAAVLALTGCSSTSTAESTASGSKASLTLGMTQDAYGWDPGQQPSYQGWAAMAVWDQLFRCDANGEPQPDIAQSFKFADDQKSFTFKVRSGMKFTDGAMVDANAVKTALEYYANVSNSRLAGLKVDVTSDLAGTVTVPKAIPTLKLLMCYQAIPSPASVKAGAASKKWTTPVGSGPYVLDTAATTTGSVYTFSKNKDYWDSKEFPYKKLVLKVLANNTAAVNALKTGQIDGTIVPGSSYNEAKSASGVKITTLKGPNTSRLLITDHEGSKIPALGNVDVRKAMNMVFDRKAMAKNLYQGHASPAYQIFKPGSDAYIDGLKDPYPYNVDEAKKLMAKAGYADGFTLPVPYIQDAGGLDVLFPYVKQQLGLLNIKVKQVTLSGPNQYADLLGGDYPVPLWQLGNYGQSLQDIQDYVTQDGIWNVEHQPDVKVAALWADITAGKDAAKAQKEINQYVIDQAWFVPMVYADNFYAHSSKVTVGKSSDYAGLQPMLWDFK